MNENVSFGARIRRLRESRGVGQADLARRVGVTPSTLNLIEKGRNKMVRGDTAVRLAQALNVPVEWLVFGDTREPMKPAVDVERLARVIAACEEGQNSTQLDLSSQNKAALIASVYESMQDHNGESLRETIEGISDKLVGNKKADAA